MRREPRKLNLFLYCGMACAALLLGGAVSAQDTGNAVDSVPDAAQADLAAGFASYRAGKYREAVVSFQGAMAAGARTGLMYYRIGYCHEVLGDHQANLDYKRRAVPYLSRQIEDGKDGVDPYYYLAATYYNDLAQPDQGDRVAGRAMEAYEAGRFGDDLDAEELFRLARLSGFALEALSRPGKAGGAANAVRRQELQRRQVFTFRRSVQALEKQEPRNRSYLVLALNEMALITEQAGNVMEAVRLYGHASRTDPTDADAGRALTRIGMLAIDQGDLALAEAALLNVRGPHDLKSPAQYALRLVRKASAHGDLPTRYQEQPISGLDRLSLEQGILEAAVTLRMGEAAADVDAAGAEEFRRQQGIFYAMMITYLRQGFALREFTVANQLVPLVFR